MMSSVALRYHQNKDDALQGINYGFLKVLQNIGTYNNKFTLSTWIRNILVHHFIDEYRKSDHTVINIPLDEASVAVHHLSTNLAEYHFSELELREMLNNLPKVTRTVFNLFAIEGYRHSEISELLGMSVGTSKWHVSDARKKLGSMLKKRNRTEKKMIGASNEQ